MFCRAGAFLWSSLFIAQNLPEINRAMPYNPSTGVYSLPAIYLAIPGTVIIAAQHNTPLEDLATANNYARPVIAGGTGSNTPAGAATNLQVLSLAGGTMTGAIDMDGKEIIDPIGKFLSGFIYGLVLTNNASDAANDIDIAAGRAASDASIPYVMDLPATLTKRIDASWAVGNGNGGLDTGAVGNNVYYVWEIQRSDTGVTDSCFSLSNTSPTFGGNIPVAYDRKRVVGSFARVAGSNCAPRSYSQKEATPWVSYVPTTAGFGTIDPASVVRSRRNGANLEVIFNIITGATSGTTASISLGYNGVNGKITIDNAWNFARFVAGPSAMNQVLAVNIVIIGIGGASDVNIGVQNSTNAGLTPLTGVTLGASYTLAGSFSVPVQGWN